jgi:hypothetical protein
VFAIVKAARAVYDAGMARHRIVVGWLLLVGCSSGAGGTTVSLHSVLERNKHPSRDGLFVEPALTKAAAQRMATDAAFNAVFTGPMWASPLYLENGPHGKGVFFAVTQGNDVFALDETTGAVVWTKRIGTAAADNGAGCGNIRPIGILSTPVIDAAARTIYVAGAVGEAIIARHEVHALSVDDGSERAGWPVDVSKMTAGTLQFAPPVQNQRSALSLVGGILYVAYGGHVGDCGAYHGWVVAIDSKNPARTGAWATGGQGEGIWASGGMASDGTGVFAVTGNATGGTTTHLDSEEVVRITGLGVLDRTGTKSFYFPSAWKIMDDNDQDFGSNSPVYLEVPDATPPTLVMAVAKNGHFYLLDSHNLGGMDGHVVDYQIANGGVGIHTAPAAYTSATGVHVTFWADKGIPCPGTTGVTDSVMVSMLIPAGAPPKPQIAWCFAAAGGAAPIATTTDGKSDVLVWFMSGDKLIAIDGETGASVFQEATGSCPNVRHWTSPIAVKGRIVVGADNRLCSWSVH